MSSVVDPVLLHSTMQKTLEQRAGRIPPLPFDNLNGDEVMLWVLSSLQRTPRHELVNNWIINTFRSDSHYSPDRYDALRGQAPETRHVHDSADPSEIPAAPPINNTSTSVPGAQQKDTLVKDNCTPQPGSSRVRHQRARSTSEVRMQSAPYAKRNSSNSERGKLRPLMKAPKPADAGAEWLTAGPSGHGYLGARAGNSPKAFDDPVASSSTAPPTPVPSKPRKRHTHPVQNVSATDGTYQAASPASTDNEHTPGVVHTCPDCHHDFPSAWDLKRHRTSVHPEGHDRLVFKCLVKSCGKECSREDNRDEHLITRHSHRKSRTHPREGRCFKCNALFGPRDMRTHLETRPACLNWLEVHRH